MKTKSQQKEFFNKQDKSIEIISLKNDPEYIHGCLASLPKIQNSVIKTLYYIGHAASVREIRKTIISDMYTHVEQYRRDHFDNKEVKEAHQLYPYKLNYGDSIGLMNEFRKNIKKDIKSIFTKTDELAKIFSASGIEIPSFKTIENGLNELLELGFVGRRESRSGRIKYLWFINPILRPYLKNIYEKKED